MAYFLLLQILQIFNPSQGGIGVGIAGALFSIVPVLWFWVGRQYGTTKVVERLLYSIVLPVALVSAIVGLYQILIGPLPYERAWLDANPQMLALFNVGGGKIRSFGFATSGAEYARIVGIGTILAIIAPGRKRLWLLMMPIIFLALILSSVRGVLLQMVFALVLAFVLRKGQKVSVGSFIRLGVLLVIALSGLSAIASRAMPQATSGSKSAVTEAIAHEAGGIADPLNDKKSTLGVHGFYILNGLLEGFRYPIGHGLGFTTSASVKFGTSSFDTEVDVFDNFISLGLVGGFLYFYIVLCVMWNVVNYTYFGPPVTRLAILAVLVCGLGSWMNGGSYSTAAIWMFLAGSVTRPYAFPRRAVTQKMASIDTTQQSSNVRYAS